MKDAVGKGVLNKIIAMRESGWTIIDVASQLGIYPWQVSYVSKFIKACVSMEEYVRLSKEATAYGMTIGELLMDVFNNHFEEYEKKRKKQCKNVKAA